MNKSNTKKYILNHFKKLNLRKNDNLIIHSDITSFGIYNSNLPKYILDLLIKIVGPRGTIALPLYNTELDKSKVFNPLKDYGKKENSILSKFFFKNYKPYRTHSILHSHLVKGSLVKKFKEKNNYHSFGKNSDFEFFHNNNFKLLLLGCDAKQGCTYLHHIENEFNVNYRYEKILNIKIIVNKEEKLKKLKYNVRKNNILLNFNKIFFLQKVKKITITSNLKFGKSYLVNLKEFDKVCRKIINKRPNILLK